MQPSAIPETEGPLFNPPALRRDVENFKVQDNVYFQTYWKIFGIGKGPAVLLYLFGIETLKFDIYGKDKGHYHVNPNNPEAGDANILLMPEPDAVSQVGRAVFELKHNIHYYLQRNADERIRSLEIDDSSWNDALGKVESRLLMFLDTVPDLQGL